MNTDYLKFLPLLALLIFCLPPKFKGWWSFSVILIGALLYSAGALGSLLNIDLGCGAIFSPLSSVFAIAIAITGVSTSLYAVGYLRSYIGRKSNFELSFHYVCMVALVYSMWFVVQSVERFDFLMWWELMTLSSFMLVMFNAAKKEVLHAAIGYLILMHVGFFCLLIGFGNQPADALWGYGSMPLWVWVVLIAGFGLKAGIFPLHVWLPVAHPVAPSHISALMSGVMIKMGVYGIFRATLAVGDTYTAGYILFIIGIVTAFFGIYKASAQTDLKKLLAYSSIENIGIIVLGIGLGTIGKACSNPALALAGYGGALLHMINHSSYKTMLFLSAGSIMSRTHSSSMTVMGGLMKRMPITGVLFLCAVFAICAIPPFSGFFSEFTLLSGMFGAIADGSAPLEASLGIITLAMIGGLTILTFAKAFGISMLGTPRSQLAHDATEVNRVMLVSLTLPLASVLVGAVLYPHAILGNSGEIFGVASNPSQILGAITWVEISAVIMIVLVGGLITVRYYLQRERAISSAPTWGCGFTAPTPDIQYNANAVSSELQNILHTKSSPSPLATSEVYPTEHSFGNKTTDKASTIITSFSSQLLHRMTARLALFQTGRTNHYILHALLFIVFILVLSLIGIM